MMPPKGMEARSFDIHESRSLALEMQLARSRPFAQLLAPLLARHFGPQPAFEANNLFRLLIVAHLRRHLEARYLVACARPACARLDLEPLAATMGAHLLTQDPT